MNNLGPSEKREFAQFKDVLTTAVRAGAKQLDDQQKVEPRFWISVTSGMSGWFAVMLWDGPGFMEPWDTGIGRHPTKAAATIEARQWATEENLEFIG